MREVPQVMARRWREGAYIGDARPAARVVVRRPQMKLSNFGHPAPKFPPVSPTGITLRFGQKGIWQEARLKTTQEYASYLWNDSARPQELPNIKSVQWSRGTDLDVGQCTIEVWNCKPMPIDAVPVGTAWDIMQAGAMVYSYGGVQHSSRWGHSRNEWFGWLMPDNLVEVHEGYGMDPTKAAELDPNLVQTGLWKIKDVEMTTDSRVLRLVCEDMGSLFTDQIAYPPVVPQDWYPLSFGPIPEPLRLKQDVITNGAKIPATIRFTSNKPWNNDRPMHGHAPAHATDGDPACVDTETEIFTQRGWLRYDEVQSGDRTLGIDPKTWEVCWTDVWDVHRYAWDGELTRMKFRRHDSLTTGNHTWPTRRRQRGKSTAGGFIYEMRETRELAAEDQIPLTPGKIAGLPEQSRYSDAFVEMVAWGWTDSHVTKTGQVIIGQSRTANPDSCDRIDRALAALGPSKAETGENPLQKKAIGTFHKVHELHEEGLNQYQIADRLGIHQASVWNYLHRNPSRWTRRDAPHLAYWTLSHELSQQFLAVAPDGLPSYEFLNELTLSQLELFVHVSRLADGWDTRGQEWFCAEHEEEARVFEYAALLSGRGVSTHWEKQIYKGRETGIWKTLLLQQGPTHPVSRRVPERVSKEHYTGTVWCPATGTGTWLMRRNGKVSFTGNSFWLSVGNIHPSRGFAYEYIDFSTGGAVHLDEVRFSTVGAGYTAYLSVSTDNAASWHGAEVIGWRSESIGRNGGNIPFVQAMPVTSEGTHTFKVNMTGVTHFRVTLGNLQYFDVAGYKYRGAFREISAHSGQQITQQEVVHETIPKSAQAGSYAGVANDWSDVITMCLAWGGLYWPRGAKRLLSNGQRLTESPVDPDPVLAADGRVWADIERTGTMGPAGYRQLDKRSLLEVMRGVADITGFLLWWDETGAAQWRMPNLFSTGNWIVTETENPRRTQEVISLDEATSLLNLTSRISSRNVRETIFVGNPIRTIGDSEGAVAARVAGWNPNPTGLRRGGGWADQGFETKEEAEVMADMIALRAAFSYRQNTATIPGFPAIQIDDQVRIYERTLSEGFLHYVQGISSTNDLTSGQWTYELTTHWLGTSPQGTWSIDPSRLTRAAQRYIQDAVNSNLPTARTDLKMPFRGNGLRGQAANP